MRRAVWHWKDFQFDTCLLNTMVGHRFCFYFERIGRNYFLATEAGRGQSGSCAQRKSCATRSLADSATPRHTFANHRFWRIEMDKIKQIGAAALIATLLGSLSACDQMSTRQRDTAVGAGVGGVAGAALGGSALSTVGGAAAGGLIGNQVGK
jgi:osmotically inducible lipoprotein OsmB